ncbi:hypothetical protein FO519_000172 [Halicephalobus sp. NKZ332]|nr:hypothetical protein FO519_000172 [Halicephalobus sp. NKZ332]
MPRVKITPITESLVENGIGIVERFEDAVLRKFDWPAVPGRRAPEGGNGGEFFSESIKVRWDHDKLLLMLPNTNDIEIPMGFRHSDEITFEGSFIAQLDADVAYFPEKHLIPLHSKDFLIFVCVESTTTEEKMFRALKVPHGYGIIIESCVAHSMPIPLHDSSVEFKVYHRSVNAVAQFTLTEPIKVNLKDVDTSTTITITKQAEGREDTRVKLPLDFSSEKLEIEPATQQNFCSYGLLVEDFERYKDTVTAVPWPCTAHLFSFPGLEPQSQEDNLADCRGGSLVQDFKMTWVPHHLHPEKKNIRFNGLSGSFEGAEGKPGVEFDATTGIYKVNILQARPDGSFYIHPKSKNKKFLMVVAKPNKENGEPLKETLKVFSFSNGQGARLPPNTWHSVPIPLATEDEVVFTEVVAETNANLIANVEFESNGPIVFTL